MTFKQFAYKYAGAIGRDFDRIIILEIAYNDGYNHAPYTESLSMDVLVREAYDRGFEQAFIDSTNAITEAVPQLAKVFENASEAIDDLNEQAKIQQLLLEDSANTYGTRVNLFYGNTNGQKWSIEQGHNGIQFYLRGLNYRIIVFGTIGSDLTFFRCHPKTGEWEGDPYYDTIKNALWSLPRSDFVNGSYMETCLNVKWQVQEIVDQTLGKKPYLQISVNGKRLLRFSRDFRYYVLTHPSPLGDLTPERSLFQVWA